MTSGAKRDLGKGLDQVKVDDVVEHWKIEGYDVYPFASWEGTHTSRGANIERDGTHITQVRNLSEARGWIREQIAQTPDDDNDDEVVRTVVTAAGALPLIVSDLAQAAAKIRADIKAAVVASTLPPYPEGITFRVTSRRASLMTAIDIDILGVPRSWAYTGGRGQVSRPSPANLLLREALRKIAEPHFHADSRSTFITTPIHLADTEMAPAAAPAPADPVTEQAGKRAAELFEMAEDENWLGI